MSVTLRKPTDQPLELPGLSEADALGSLTVADAGRFRLVVTPDPEADGPIQWGHLAVVPSSIVSGTRMDSTPEGGTDPIDLARTMSLMSGEDYGRQGIAYGARRPSLSAESTHTDRVLEAAIRWARVFHGVEVTRWQPHGASQSEWGDALVYLEADDERAASLDDQQQALDGWLTDAACWYRGEVVGLRPERDAGDDEWVAVDDCDVWGFYGVSTARDASEAAAESFGLPRDFALAVPVTYQDVAW